MTSPVSADAIPKFYPIGPNTCGGYHSKGDGGELAIPDYMHPELGPDHTPLGSPAKVTLWFKSWDEAKQFMAFIDQARIRAQCAPEPDLLAVYRDIFAEITAKAMPVCDQSSDDPDRVRYYRLPVGPIHRAAGKLNFQMFDGEANLARAIKDAAQARDAAIEECARVCENGEWVGYANQHSPTKSCALAIRDLKDSAFTSPESQS